MIFQGYYIDNTKELIQSFDEEMNKKNAELETAQAEAAAVKTENADMEAALAVMGVEPE